MKAAAYSGTRNLYEAMVPAVKSLLYNSDVERVYLLIEDDEFPYELPKCVETINVSEQTTFPKYGPNMKSKFSYMALLRSTYAKMFPDLDRILSLDVDTMVVDWIGDMWDMNLQGYYFAACPEPGRCGFFTYTNIGVAMYNLEALRDGKCQEVIDLLNTKRLSFVEQDAFNLLCQTYIKDLPGEYNVCDYTPKSSKRKILHYAGLKLEDYWNEATVQKYLKADWPEKRRGQNG